MASLLRYRIFYVGSRYFAASLLALMLATAGTFAQDSAPDTQVTEPAQSSAEQPQQAPSEQPAEARPGLLDALGGWIKDSADGVSSNLKGTQQRIDDFNKGTLDTLGRLPSAGMVTGRSVCQLASNGAPDCYAASEKLCKDKGYTSGKSLSTESAQNCKARIYLPGYKRQDGDCRIDTIVTRASCQ